MQLCKPCQERGRETEAVRLVHTGDAQGMSVLQPWCKWCFGGCVAPGQFTPENMGQGRKGQRMKVVGPCKNEKCDRGITNRSKSGYCHACSRDLRSLNKKPRPVAARIACKAPDCAGTVTAQSKTGYCQWCLSRNIGLRAKLYPSQRPEVVTKRALKSYLNRKYAAMGVKPVAQEARA